MRRKKKGNLATRLVKHTVIGTGVLFALYMTNADSKLVEVVYDGLYKYHQNKKVEDKI